ncbi:MAG TPA: EscV/YscV/HrcV family type III secretion system export apparatus protein [Clostridiales bacterium]|nr:EscV/YscV/HrcV family type III secretion system export apparatus protein [Clostridiales bacterium]
MEAVNSPKTAQGTNAALAAGVGAIVLAIVLPLPPLLLDLLLSFNLSLSLVILFTSLYTREPVQFSSFPSLLLITTLFRLALNVSATRLILLNASAGQVIDSFGRFVVGGNAVVGFLIFIIIVVIQFLVITRGAERVAEVAARFTLDAMPGKQLAIDADLNAGLVGEDEARGRRAAIEQEADFYGAMDGAAKYIKGDAMAALFIVAVNLIGGFITGIIQLGFTFDEALATYALLTVGNGLATQIPALLVSTAMGFVVTRAAGDSELGQDLSQQLARNPRVLGLTGAAVGLLGLVPGLPTIPFLALSAGTLALMVAMQRRIRQQEAGAKHASALPAVPEDLLGLIDLDPLEVELGYGLLVLADQTQGGDLLNRVAQVRRQTALDLGISVPPVRIRDNLNLKPQQYTIRLRSVPAGKGELPAGRSLAIGPDELEPPEDAIRTQDPAFGLPAWWVPREAAGRAETLGYTVVEPSAVIATHLSELVRRHAPDLFGRQELQGLVELMRARYPALVDDLLPHRLSLGEVLRVIQNLLREGVPLRDPVGVFEALADASTSSRDPEVLTGFVRRRLRRQLRVQFDLGGGRRAVTVDPEAERRILENTVPGEEGPVVRLDPQTLRAFQHSLREQLSRIDVEGRPPLLLCSGPVRAAIRRVAEATIPGTVVLAYDELDSQARVDAVGMVGW